MQRHYDLQHHYRLHRAVGDPADGDVRDIPLFHVESGPRDGWPGQAVKIQNFVGIDYITEYGSLYTGGPDFIAEENYFDTDGFEFTTEVDYFYTDGSFFIAENGFLYTDGSHFIAENGSLYTDGSH